MVRNWRTVAVFVGLAGLAFAAEDAREIVKRSVDEHRRNYKLAENYTYIEREEQREIDKQGRVTRRTVRTYDVTLTEGSPYRRLIARDDKPLPPAEEERERRRLEKSIAERRSETHQQRAKRLEEWQRRRERQNEFVREFLDAFEFRLLGDETIEGRRAYVIDVTPRPAYRAKTRAGKFLSKLKGRLWVDAQAYDWVRSEAEATDTVSYLGFAFRLNPGSRLSLEQTRINDEIWLPKRVSVTASGRILLLKRFGGEWDLTYRDYKKFQTETRIVPAQE